VASVRIRLRNKPLFPERCISPSAVYLIPSESISVLPLEHTRNYMSALFSRACRSSVTADSFLIIEFHARGMIENSETKCSKYRSELDAHIVMKKHPVLLSTFLFLDRSVHFKLRGVIRTLKVQGFRLDIALTCNSTTFRDNKFILQPVIKKEWLETCIEHKRPTVLFALLIYPRLY
jgi:hypothetical protein